MTLTTHFKESVSGSPRTEAARHERAVIVVRGSHTLDEMKADMLREMTLGNFDELKERDIA